MADERAQRRLAAILAADVVGYSRLMEQDEVGTLTALKERRKGILQPLVAEHSGRIAKVMGDGVLVEFASAVNAVACAVELQKRIATANVSLPDDRHIVLRIGINLGDVMVEGSDLYGDGVNIAARLEGIAEPGGILISGTTYDYIKNKVDVGFDDLGTQTLKNIAEAVRVYRVAGTPRVSVAIPKAATDKPSVAVLPFTNMSGDPEQQYFSDGITEDIITELSRFRSLFVIARNSSFQYRASAVDVRRVARELGVQYVVEGSVRRLGDRLRITAQLIDANTGNHLWSERYDRDLKDIFAVQDQVVQTVILTIVGRVKAAQLEVARRKRTANLAAYDCYLRGLESFNSAGAEADTEANAWFAKAIDLDPQYAESLARFAFNTATLSYYDDGPVRLDHARTMAERAIAIDPNESWGYRALAYIDMCHGDLAASAENFKRAMRLNPNDPDFIALCSLCERFSGRSDSAVEMIANAERLNPLPPLWYRTNLAGHLFNLRDYAGAARIYESVGERTFYWDHYSLAACYVKLGRMSDARAELAKAISQKPGLNLRSVANGEPYADRAELEHHLEPLRQLGLPE
jgi:TolB-like protein/tetratricopeptide (TPR) repeat protein